MESPHGAGKIHENEPHDTVIVAEGDQGEKKSYFGKAKAKAKKMRDTFTKHGHEHHEHVPDDHDLDEEDHEDEEMLDDPKTHGAPVYDSAAATKSDPHNKQDIPVSHNATTGIHQTKDSFPSRTVVGEVPHAPPQVPVSLDPPGVHHSKDNVPSKTAAGGVLDLPGIHHSGGNDPSRTAVRGQQDRPGQQKNNLERPESVEEDHSASKDTPGGHPSSKYQTKVTDPTGKDVAGGEEAEFASALSSLEKMKVYDGSETGSHDQFSPEFTLRKPQEQLHGDDDRPSNQSSYTEKISSTASAISDKAISAKNVVASKLGYGEKDNTGGPEIHPRGEKDNTGGLEIRPRDGEGVESPSNQGGGYAEKISFATSAVADRAISAKNVVASKFGYGEKDNTGGDKNSEPTPTSPALDYGKKDSATVTEKPASFYGKVAGAGSAVMSKLPGTGTGNQQQGVEGDDKGASVREHIAEKLKPGEEDKALAEVISEALHKPKPERPASRPLNEVVSDNMHLRNEEADDVSRPMGKVTESEEVARRLGTPKDDDHDPSEENKGMVDKIRGAVGSWLGKGDQSPGTQLGSPRDDGGALQDTSSGISGKREPQ